ncbi:MAG: aminotransferase class V-fold PLP-dependent enzyme [Acidimicrobiales bacterium]|jgi:lysine decarboxylase
MTTQQTANEFAPRNGKGVSLRDDAPLLDGYLKFLESAPTPFTTPGHKQRASTLDRELGVVLAGDVPLYGGVDLAEAEGALVAKAEARYANWLSADWCRYSSGGSTHCNQALSLAIGQPGDKIVVTRSHHRSLLLGMVMADLIPCWLPSTTDATTGLPLGVAVEDVEAALSANPDARAVLVTEPGYLGTMSDLGGITEVAHSHDVPVIVDQAWGAHFGHHPELPPHAMALGADAMVTSIHKLLLGYNQASLVCARTQRLDRARLERGFEASMSTSVAGSVLASIDGCRALMEARGEELVGRILPAIRSARQRLRDEVPGLEVPDEHSFPPGRFDPMRFVVLLASVGSNGIEVERLLLEQGITLELVDRDTILAIVSVADNEATLDRLVNALVPAIRSTSGPWRPASTAVSWKVQPVTVMTPRAAFFAAHESVTAEAAIGRVSAELIAPYPPGIPVLAPGELVTEDLVASLQAVAADGVRVAYAADPTLQTFQVVKAQS